MVKISIYKSFDQKFIRFRFEKKYMIQVQKIYLIQVQKIYFSEIISCSGSKNILR